MMLKVESVRKSYFQGASEIEVLKGVDLEVQQGETLSILGPSGGGKSTLLSILSGITPPSSGRVSVKGQDLQLLSEEALTRFRGKHYGIVFQQFHLIEHLSALENVMLPLEIIGKSSEAPEKARQYLEEVGLGQRLEHLPRQLSGGEAQRVAIARALVSEPKIILADEPSGNLDVRTGQEVMGLLFELVKKHKTTMVLVTHSLELAQRCEKTLVLESGCLRIPH